MRRGGGGGGVPGPSQPRDALSQVHQPRVTLETSPSSGHWWSRVSLQVVTCHMSRVPTSTHNLQHANGYLVTKHHASTQAWSDRTPTSNLIKL